MGLLEEEHSRNVLLEQEPTSTVGLFQGVVEPTSTPGLFQDVVELHAATVAKETSVRTNRVGVNRLQVTIYNIVLLVVGH